MVKKAHIVIMAYYLSNFLQLARTCCPCLSKDTEETVQFVKYKRFHEDREMTEMNTDKSNGSENGVIPKVSEPNGDIPCRNLADSNKITEWQAGWNVTNAIQVNTFQICLSTFHYLLEEIYCFLCICCLADCTSL